MQGNAHKWLHVLLLGFENAGETKGAFNKAKETSSASQETQQPSYRVQPTAKKPCVARDTHMAC